MGERRVRGWWRGLQIKAQTSPIEAGLPSDELLSRTNKACLKVALKNASYSSFVTSLGERTQSGLLSFCTAHASLSFQSVFMTAAEREGKRWRVGEREWV